jgi:hypothetical protein
MMSEGGKSTITIDENSQSTFVGDCVVNTLMVYCLFEEIILFLSSSISVISI